MTDGLEHPGVTSIDTQRLLSYLRDREGGIMSDDVRSQNPKWWLVDDNYLSGILSLNNAKELINW